jgi:hypothetical protein
MIKVAAQLIAVKYIIKTRKKAQNLERPNLPKSIEIPSIKIREFRSLSE